MRTGQSSLSFGMEDVKIEKIHAWINLLYDWLQKGLTEFVAAHEAVAVTFDGGKDISGNKLIAFCVTVGGILPLETQKPGKQQHIC
ncbi:hypothetical protein Pelo_10827 [Pelomyxa schiedti]|nr:hypothetical protein Pelo_10827 [Pelomyxa schiedti]